MKSSAPKATALLGLFLLLGTSASSEDLVVDFSRPTGPATHRACGFLHGITAVSPDDSLLAPLKIRYVRGAPHGIWGLPGLLDAETRKRLSRPDLRMALGVSYYDRKKVAGHETYFPGDNGDWASWESMVENVVNEARSKQTDCVWVIWNEPDYEKFWPHDVDRFRETWKRAYRRIKSLDATAVITGPTISKYSFNYLTSFLAYCKENECVPDMVTWHELTKIENHIKANVDDIRRWCKQNNVAIKGIIVDEYGNKSGQYLPGPAVGFISAFEEAEVTFASRAIWTKTGTLCGATTQDGKKPLSLWWVYKAYSDIAGTLYDVVQTANLRAIAGADDTTSSTAVLIGNQSKDAHPANLVLQNLTNPRISMQKCTVRRRLIPNSDSNALEAPEALPEIFVEAANDALKFDVGLLPGYGAVEVLICRDQPKTSKIDETPQVSR